jgi:hypothetical protein
LVLAEANGVLITGTSATTILVFTAPRRGLYEITPYLEVANAATVVTVTVSWTDPVNGADSYSWYTNQSLGIGDYSLHSFLVRASGGTQITLTITAGTANNVTASAWIEGRV